MNSSYIMESSYFSFMMDKSRQDANMNRFFDACLMLDENATVDTMALNEGVGDSIKNGWNKFIEFIKNLIAKFIESLTNLTRNGKPWLEKYKDVILTKKANDIDINDMPPYDVGIQRISNTTIPQLQFSAMENNLNSREDLIKYIIKPISSSYGTYFPEGADTKMDEGLKNYFLGGAPRSVKMSQLNLTDLYNFCYQSDTLIDSVKKDQNNIKAGSTEAENAIRKAINKLSDKEKDEINKNTETPAASNDKKDTTTNDNTKENNNDQKKTQTNTDQNKMSDAEAQSLENRARSIVAQMTSKINEYNNNKIKAKNSGNKYSAEEVNKAKDFISNNSNIKDTIKSMEDELDDINNKLTKGGRNEIRPNITLMKEEFYTTYKGNMELYNIINEVSFSDNSKNNSGNSNKPSGASTPNVNSSLNTANQSNVGANKSSEIGTNNAASSILNKNNNDASAAINAVSDRVTVYNDVTKSICTAKISAMQEIYKSYMEILRVHVRSIVGNEQNVDDVVAKNATNYENSNYNETKYQDFKTAKEKYYATKSQETLTGFVNMAKKLYGNRQWGTRLAKKGNDELACAEYFYTRYENGYLKTQSNK